jgi:predicted dithiol-disulfide oxidoreductase (DUF899 family)
MTDHRIVSRNEWTDARRGLLAREKEFLHLRDELSRQRRELPWERVGKSYSFSTPNGRLTLADLFGERSQLIVCHLMFAPEWEAACKNCSFWADHYSGMVAHLAQRDVSFVAISRAPLAKLQAFAKRMGWSFPWVSSEGTDFNYDFQASFRPEDMANGKAIYNYAPLTQKSSDMPGISVFAKDEHGDVFHTYSTYGRGIEPVNGTYQLLDLVPKGRDEASLPFPMTWVKLHDQYPQ